MVVKFIKPLYQARLYVDKIVIKVFVLSTVVCAISILCMFWFCDNNIVQGIAMSVIAAYIFYLMIEFIPALTRAYENIPSMAIVYRHLQLLLLNLDGIYLEAYEEIYNLKSTNPRSNQDMDLGVDFKTFFEKQFLFGILNYFPLLKMSKIIGQNRPYIELFIDRWQRVSRHAVAILNTPYSYNDELLKYALNYLIIESSMAVTFDFYMKGRPGAWPLHVNFASILGFDPKGISWDEPTMESIKQLHESAFKMYDFLKKDERVRHIVCRPDFYKE